MNENSRRDSGPEIVDRLVRGDAAAWEAFVRRFSPVIWAAVQKVVARAPAGRVEAADVAQEVFLRLCKDDFRLMRRYEPERAALSTWLTVVATSTAIDALRRERGVRLPLDALPPEAVAVAPVEPAEKLKIPAELLSPRQRLVMELIFERDMGVAEAAALLRVDPQTVRSTQHKALVKLRKFFAAKDPDRQG